MASTERITQNMRARGGGILDIELIDKTNELENYYQLKASFDTVDSMGANFINSCLEQFGAVLKEEIIKSDIFSEEEKHSLQVIMSILSNFTPECLVRAEVSCKIDELKDGSGISPQEFAWKFHQAVTIAEIEPYRAVTHNKGIMNGVDAVVIATGNDFRAIEASAHAYAAKDGKYCGLTEWNFDEENNILRGKLTLPMPVASVGGSIGLNPTVKAAFNILKNPDAKTLAGIIVSVGLAQNFAALKALVSTGIQKGHMKLQARSLALFAGAENEEVDIVVEKLLETNRINSENAKNILKEIRNLS